MIKLVELIICPERQKPMLREVYVNPSDVTSIRTTEYPYGTSYPDGLTPQAKFSFLEGRMGRPMTVVGSPALLSHRITTNQRRLLKG